MDLVVGSSNNAVQSLVIKVGSLLAQEYTLIAGVRDDVQYINDELASMQAFINRIKRVNDRNEQRQDWMKQVREVAYDIEDCVDKAGHSLDGEPRGSGFLNSLRRKWYLLTKLCERHSIATEIGNLKIRAQHVSERRTRYDVKNLSDSEDNDESSADKNGPGDHVAPPLQVIVSKPPVGFNDAVLKLEHWFKEPNEMDTDRNLRFLAIVGFGGLGKTTLAMALYHKFGFEFSFRASVLASQKFHPLTFLRGLVEQFHEQREKASKNDLQGIDDWKEDQFKRKLCEQLSKKRYIILVDDIWTVSALEKIKDSLPKGGTGSIVVTTRFNSVAQACRRHNGMVHNIEPLTVHNSIYLFRETTTNPCPKLTPKDTDVMLKCTGRLPLAIVLVAGLLAAKVKSDQNSTTISKHMEEVEKALSIVSLDNLTSRGVTQLLDHCYKDLPADLKTCLLYMSMFPKGCQISRKRLIRRWIAEGFISEKHGKTVEEVTEECFNELISRNLVRAVNSNSNGKVKSCQIHDMVLQYIVSKSSDENFITVVGSHWQTPSPSYKVRRLSIHKSARQEKDTIEKMELSHVRSLTVVGGFRAILHSTLQKFRILQVLDLEGCKDLSYNQLSKVCNMHPLKYLSLRRTDVEKIPRNISRLHFLEVLDLRETEVKKLPASVDKLQRMTHLLAGDKSKQIALKLTFEITKMTALQTLSGIEICGSLAKRTSKGPSGGAGAQAEEEVEEKTEKEEGREGKPLSSVGANEAQPPSATEGAKDGPGSCCCNRQFKWLSRCKASSTIKNKDSRTVAALENLTRLKKFTVYKVTRFTNDDNFLLLSAIEHLSSCSLEFLEINDDFSGFLDSSLKSWEAPPEHLHTLGFSGLLSRVPNWIYKLQNLEKLTLSLTSLTAESLNVLATLPRLFSLVFTLDAAKVKPSVHKMLQNNTLKTEGAIFVRPGGFKELKLLRFATQMLPRLIFLEGAMPKLQRIELLRLRMIEGVYGLENLKDLRQVILAISSQAPKDAKEKAFQIRKLASMIKNGPSLVLNEYNESSKDQ